MIDLHSHILPAIDDGSKSVEESLELMKLQRSQGVDIAVATPHFYPARRSVSEFLDRREAACARLAEGLPEIGLALIPGAEVLYYEGISRLQDLEKLTLGNSGLLLLEMPVSKWTDYVVSEVLHLAGSGQFRIVIAHVERCADWKNRALLDRFVENGILLQANASLFLNRLSRRRAFAELKNNRIHLLGSDCHNLTSRPPRLGEAWEAIEQKFGSRFVGQMDAFAHDLFPLK